MLGRGYFMIHFYERKILNMSTKNAKAYVILSPPQYHIYVSVEEHKTCNEYYPEDVCHLHTLFSQEVQRSFRKRMLVNIFFYLKFTYILYPTICELYKIE